MRLSEARKPNLRVSKNCLSSRFNIFLDHFIVQSVSNGVLLEVPDEVGVAAGEAIISSDDARLHHLVLILVNQHSFELEFYIELLFTLASDKVLVT